MKWHSCLAAVLAAAILPSLTASAQTSPPAQRRPRPRPAAVRIIVRDRSGSPVSGAHVNVSGPAAIDATTDATGASAIPGLKDGTYRIRVEREGFITLEREVTVRAGLPAEVAIALSAALPAPTPAPTPSPTPPPQSAAGPSGPPVTVSIPAFLDKNFIGRDPLKESILGCAPDAMARLLQLRDPIAVHSHNALDELLYVVAGEGSVKIRNDEKPVVPGTLTVIPRGTPHAIDRHGKNPLVVLSILTGSGCKT
jgi:mannose-6-phosphate isomerase-like protein (cupin superfamily)